MQFDKAEISQRMDTEIKEGVMFDSTHRGALQSTMLESNLVFKGFPEGTTKEDFARFLGSRPVYGGIMLNHPVAFVQFVNRQDAEDIKQLVRTEEVSIGGQTCRLSAVGFVPKRYRKEEFKKQVKIWATRSIFVKGLPQDITEQKIVNLFSDCGEIDSVRLIYLQNRYFDESGEL